MYSGVIPEYIDHNVLSILQNSNQTTDLKASENKKVFRRDLNDMTWMKYVLVERQITNGTSIQLNAAVQTERHA